MIYITTYITLERWPKANVVTLAVELPKGAAGGVTLSRTDIQRMLSTDRAGWQRWFCPRLWAVVSENYDDVRSALRTMLDKLEAR